MQRRAEEALRRGDFAAAREAQQQAMSALQDRSSELARLNDENDPKAREARDERDILGRLNNGESGYGDTVKIPDEMERQKARDILNEIRRRARRPHADHRGTGISQPPARTGSRSALVAHDHHDHDHHDGDDPDNELDPMTARVRALETILAGKGLIDPAAIDAIVDVYENKVGPRNGAKVVAEAWSDPAFADWLKRDATAAIASLGFTGRQGEHMQAVFNTGDTHNLVVCTLCSCYPWTVLGLPPVWYKSPPYRSRAVIDPRGVLAEFGLALAADMRVRVWDSTAELRYLVVPIRPEGTDGFSRDQLAALVTRDAMIGTGLPLPPGSP